MKKQIVYLLILLGLALSAQLALAVPSTLAQDPAVSDDQVNQVAEHLNCPTCQTLALDDCNTLTCSQWKEQIRDLLADGYSQDEILDWYVVRYGDQVLQEPPRRGMALYVWLLPVVTLLAGTVWVVLVMRQWLRKNRSPRPVAEATAAEQVTEEPAETADDYLKRVESDLKNL